MVPAWRHCPGPGRGQQSGTVGAPLADCRESASRRCALTTTVVPRSTLRVCVHDSDESQGNPDTVILLERTIFS